MIKRSRDQWDLIDQEISETDYLSEKLSNIFQKLYSWISIGVEKGDWSDEYRKNKLIEVNFFFKIVDSAVPLIYNYSTVMLQKVVQENI